MKRFQVEKTQRGYLAKKRKRPITQQQYYDQGVPRNVLMPPRTLLAQNILDSHGTSFFDTFSYLNFMKDYFKQNQITTPSFTDPNSLWGKITKWYRKRNERSARIDEMEKMFEKMTSKEIDDELKMAKAKREELMKNRKEESDYEEELSKLNDRIRALEKNDVNRPFYKKLLDEITDTKKWSYDGLDPFWVPSRDVSPNPDDEKETTQKTLPPIDENKDSSSVKVETPALTEEIEEGNESRGKQRTLKERLSQWFQTEDQTHRMNGAPPVEEKDDATQTQTVKAAETSLPPPNETEKEIPFPTLGENKEENYGAVISFLLSSPSLSKTWNELGRPRLIHRLSQGNKPEFIAIREHPGEITVISFADLLDPNRKADEKRLIYFNLNDKDPLNKEAETRLLHHLQEEGFPQPTIDTVMYTRKGVGENIARFNASRK